MGKMYIKQQIVQENPELVLRENGDFIIDKSLVDKYEIIDVHCHLFKGLEHLFPAIFQKEKNNTAVSLLDKSCFPFSMDLFNLDKISYTEYPIKLLSGNGIRTRIKLFTGALVLNYATVERLIMDMDANGISKSVVQQINPPNKSCAGEMDEIVKGNSRLYTFESIHPYDEDILGQIDMYMKMDIKGWKLNPHIWGTSIDDKKTIAC